MPQRQMLGCVYGIGPVNLPIWRVLRKIQGNGTFPLKCGCEKSRF